MNANFSLAQNSDTINEPSLFNGLKVSAFPIGFYLPETGFSGGGIGLATFRIKSDTSVFDRPSSIQFGAAFTSRKQLLLFMPYELYLKHGKYRLQGEVGFYVFSYNYFGIGSSSRLDDLEDYAVTFPRIDVNLLKSVSSNIFLGLGYKFDNYNITRVDEGGILDREQSTGIEGGRVSALQAAILYDSRNHLFVPSKGWYANLKLVRGVAALGSSFSYFRKTLDLRYYQKIKTDWVLASNLYLSSADEGTPFFRYPYMSSGKRARGFSDRRFIDRNLINFQMDLRFPIYKRIAGVLFSSASRLAPELTKLVDTETKFAGGVGLRVVLNKQELTRLRVDYGITSEGSNFYITLNEAF